MRTYIMIISFTLQILGFFIGFFLVIRHIVLHVKGQGEGRLKKALITFFIMWGVLFGLGALSFLITMNIPPDS